MITMIKKIKFLTSIVQIEKPVLYPITSNMFEFANSALLDVLLLISTFTGSK